MHHVPRGVAALTKSYNLISICGKKNSFFCRCICHHVFILGHLYWHGLVFFGFFALGEGGRAGLPFGLLSCHMKARSKKRRGRLFDMADVELEKCGSDRSVAPKKERGSLALPLHLGGRGTREQK